jgi:peptidoglycan-associated lipoprotein
LRADSPTIKGEVRLWHPVTLVLKPIRLRTVAALLALLLPALLTLNAPAGKAETLDNSAIEMLQDAFDALSNSEFEQAQQVFQQLILSYPGTPEAIRAEHELAVLNSRQRYRSGLDSAGLLGQRFEEPQLRRTFALEVGDRVFFAANSAAIGGRARVMLENQAKWLQQHSELKITIIGRADDGVSAENAMTISSQRAEAVRQRLISAGVDAARISLEARGLTDPVATCRTPLCQAQNRIAETWIGGRRGIGSNEYTSPVPSASLNAAAPRENRGSAALPR